MTSIQRIPNLAWLLLFGQRIHNPISLRLLLSLFTLQLHYIITVHLSSAHWTTQVLYTPFIQTSCMEDMLANSLTNSRIEIELLQANRTSLHVLFVLHRDQLSWHEFLKMGNIKDFRLGFPIIPVPSSTMSFLTINHHD